MRHSKAFWENKDGAWTLAFLLTRELCRAERFKNEILPEELYYILHFLGAKSRFADYWDRPEFYKRAGASQIAPRKVRDSGEGWATKKGDFEWAIGNVNAAIKCYEQSIEIGDSIHSGWGGKFRLYFCLKKFSECCDIFCKLCPPHEFYVKHYESLHEGNPLKMRENYPPRGTSPYFISDGRYMLQALIYAAIHSESLDQTLCEKISDYFEVSVADIRDIATTLLGNEKEFIRLKNRIQPKQQKPTTTLKNMLISGNTARARTLCAFIEQSDARLAALKDKLNTFIASGNETILDHIINNPPSGVESVDRFFMSKILMPIAPPKEPAFERTLVLLRRFGLTEYGSHDSGSFNGFQWWVGFYKRAIVTGEKLLPIDVVTGLSSVRWYDQPKIADCYFVQSNFDWCSTFLTEYIESAFMTEILDDQQKTLDFLYDAYLFVWDKYQAAISEKRWLNEELLATVIESFFGKDCVQRHAQPLWLTPQHLDIYLPSINLAIEYMGLQHYEPVDFFGGADGLRQTQERDERKRKKCEHMGVTLIYVTHEEDVGKRAKEIFDQTAGTVESRKGSVI